MSILFTKTEDEKYFIFRLKSRKLVYGLILLNAALMVSAIVASSYSSMLALVFFIFALFLQFTAYSPMTWRKTGARNMGNEIIEKGNIYFGDYYEVKIEKKGFKL